MEQPQTQPQPIPESLQELLAQIGKIHNTSSTQSAHVLTSSIRTLNEMLTDRGYEHIRNCNTLSEIIACMADQTPVVVGAARQTLLTVRVFFHNEERVGVKHVRARVEALPGDAIVFVSLAGPTSFTRKEVEQSYPHVHFFTFQQVCVNITRHHMVPRHERMTEAQIGALHFLEDADALPRLYTNDPVAQYYGYVVGDVVRIARVVGTQEPMYYYRRVCSPPA